MSKPATNLGGAEPIRLSTVEAHDKFTAAVERERAARAWVSTGRPWLILCVSPLMERKVEETLRDVGLSVYVPIEKFRPKTANVAKASKPWRPRTRPLIPGYIFADLADDRALDIARANHAVRRILCNNGEPVKVPSIAIGSMVLFEAAGAFDRTVRQSGARKGRRRGPRGSSAPEGRWKSGQRVKIAEGPFAGFLAEIVRADREDRVEVLVSIFGRMTPTTLGEAEIEGGEAS